MFDHTKTISTAAALTFAALSSSTAVAEPNSASAFSVPPVIGAAYTDASRADSVVDVRRQGGFAIAGAVRWLAQAPSTEVQARGVYVPGVIGAAYEDRSLARSAEEVRR